MSDREIRQIIIRKKRQERMMKRVTAAYHLITDAVCWIGWAALIMILSIVAA